MTETTPPTPPEANDADTVSAGTDEAADVPVDNEGPVAYSSETTPSSSAAASTGRSAVIAPASGTGRRKQAVARVRLIPGTGQWKVNGRDLDAYFPNKVHQQHVKEPLATLGVDEQYDVIANLDGGGSSGQAGALRLGVARALNEVDSEVNRPSLKRSGMLTRDARVKERRKAGLKKARKAPQYSKR